MGGQGARYPIGVYDHPPDPDVPGLRSVSVGDSFPAKLANDATGLLNKLDQKLSELLPGL